MYSLYRTTQLLEIPNIMWDHLDYNPILIIYKDINNIYYKDLPFFFF